MCQPETPDTKPSQDDPLVTSWSCLPPVPATNPHGGANPLEQYRSPAASNNRAPSPISSPVKVQQTPVFAKSAVPEKRRFADNGSNATSASS